MPLNTDDPRDKLKAPPPTGRASEALEILRSDAPLEPLPASRQPATALDLPLWRPGVFTPPADVPEPQAAEQTDIVTVMAHVTEHAYVEAFNNLYNEIRETYREEKLDMRGIYLAEQRELYSAMRELDVWAMNNGFVTAAARHVGARLANRELTPEDALAVLKSL